MQLLVKPDVRASVVFKPPPVGIPLLVKAAVKPSVVEKSAAVVPLLVKLDATP